METAKHTMFRNHNFQILQGPNSDATFSRNVVNVDIITQHLHCVIYHVIMFINSNIEHYMSHVYCINSHNPNINDKLWPPNLI